MKFDKPEDLSTEDLHKQKKTLTGVLTGFGVVMLIAYCILIYLMIKNGNFILFTLLPLGIVTLLPATIRLSQINTELKKR